MLVLLVRHAKAGDRSDWQGDDAFRPLSPAGRAQADALVPVLAPHAPARILSSPSTRCVQTVEPLAGACEVKVEDEPSLAEGHARLALALVRRLLDEDGGAGRPGSVVCCTHGDVVPEILRSLVAADGVRIGREPQWRKASTWLLRAEGGRFTAAEYLPPPA